MQNKLSVVAFLSYEMHPLMQVNMHSECTELEGEVQCVKSVVKHFSDKIFENKLTKMSQRP